MNKNESYKERKYGLYTGKINKSVNRNTKAQTLYLSDFKSTVFEKSEKLKETVNKTKGNQENDASPNNIN